MTRLLNTATGVIMLWVLGLTAPAWAEENTEPEFLITGLFINDEEKQGSDIYRDSGHYWLPLEQLGDWTNIQITLTDDKHAQISTPFGDTVVAAERLRTIDGLEHIDMAALKDLGINARFDQRAYALVIYAPWIGIQPQTAALAASPKEPDFKAADVGISRLYNRFDGTYNETQQSNRLYSDFFGHMQNGVWGLQTDVDDRQSSSLNQAYWQSFNRYAAIRLGTATANPGPSLSSPNYTGIQFGLSNLGIYNHLATTVGVSRQMLVDDAGYSHNISGTGPKGGIAELRLNGRPIARVRIALDGLYLFKRLPVTQSSGNQVEVAIYEYTLAQAPIEVLDYSIAGKQRAVSTGEWMLNAGLGALGSDFEESNEGEETHYASLRYGLSNFVTLEAATLEQSNQDSGWYTGLITSLGPHVSATLGKAETKSSDNHSAEIAGNWSMINARYSAIRTSTNDSTAANTAQNISARWKLHPDFSLVARGHSATADNASQDYLGAGFDWRVSPHASLSVLPTGREQYDSRLSLRSMDYDANMQLRAANNSYGIGINYTLANALSLSWDYSHISESEEERDLRVISAAASYRPRQNSDSVFNAQISQQSQEIGYSLGWRHRINPRTQFNLSYFRNLEDDSVLLEESRVSDSESLAISIESELWFSRRSWRHSDAKTDSKHGAISARVLGADGTPLNAQDIKLQVEGTASTLKPGENGVQNLVGLPPGDYNLKLLTEGLPIEYESNASNFRVRVSAAATTAVEITLKAHFGVAGLLTHDGIPTPHTWVSVWQDGESVANGKTDSYGYYQIAGLLPGHYELHYEDVRSNFEVVDEYLFDINMASGTAPPVTRALYEARVYDQVSEETAYLEDDAIEQSMDDIDTVFASIRDAIAGDTQVPEPTATDLAFNLIDLSTALPAGLSGRVYYDDQPLGHVTVRLHSQGRKIATVFTDSYGYYSFHHLSAGDYQVSAGASAVSYAVAKTRTYHADIHLSDDSVSAKGKSIWTAQ